MAAYMVCTMQVHSPETFRQYTALTPETLARYNGRYLTRGDEVKTVEGKEFEERMVILEFPDSATAEAWYRDEGYQHASQFRRASSTGQMLLQEGRTNTADPDPLV